MSLKQCSRCKEVKPLTAYNSNRHRKDGLNYYCRPCQQAFAKEHYNKNKSDYINRAQRFRENRRQFIITSKDNKPCSDCTIAYPYYVMDFDHARGIKTCDLSVAHCRLTIKKIREEIAKCDLVCANCHRIRTHNRKIMGNTVFLSASLPNAAPPEIVESFDNFILCFGKAAAELDLTVVFGSHPSVTPILKGVKNLKLQQHGLARFFEPSEDIILHGTKDGDMATDLAVMRDAMVNSAKVAVFVGGKLPVQGVTSGLQDELNRFEAAVGEHGVVFFVKKFTMSELGSWHESNYGVAPNLKTKTATSLCGNGDDCLRFLHKVNNW